MKNLKNLTWWLLGALMTLGTTACSDSSGSLFDGTEEQPINMSNLSGTWIAVYAVGTDAKGNRVNEREMSGIGTLDVIPLLVLKNDNTFKTYSPLWKSENSYSWTKGTQFFTTGEGTVMLVGSRLQLTQTSPKYAVVCDVVSLTRTQMVCRFTINGNNIQCTYQRTDINVNDYETGTDMPQEPSLYVDGDNMTGTWIATHVTGRDYSGEVDTRNMTGIDSLQVLPLIHINGGTFIVYSPHWQGDEQQQAGNENYTWEQGTTLLPGGKGTISYNGNRLVFTDTASQYSSPLAFTVVSLTRSTLVCRFGGDSLYDLVCTYQRVESNLR